jgi:DNA-binding NarL/FixJ family response regulator
MQGTVLLLSSDRSPLVDVFRAHGLIVYHCDEPAQALTRVEQIAPDVIVALLSGDEGPSLLPELRRLADRATSIIVTSIPEQRDVARQAGADSFLLKSAPPSDVLYEIHRALILRRSGRRVPWNW